MEGEERNNFSWREGNKKKSLPRLLLSAEQREGNRESREDQGGKRRGEKRGRTKTKALKGWGGGEGRKGETSSDVVRLRGTEKGCQGR